MKKIYVLFLVLLLVSCKKFSFGSSSGFENNRWPKNAVQEYVIVLSEDLKNAEVALSFSHVYEPGYDRVPVTLEMVSPDGQQEQFPLIISLKDKDGKNLSDCSGDICELLIPVKSGVQLKKGTHIFRLKNEFNNVFLPNVLQAGIELKGNN